MLQNENHIPEHIRLNLKPFKQHINGTCLECGYNGIMGRYGAGIGTYILIFLLCLGGAVLAITGVSFLMIVGLTVCSFVIYRAIAGIKAFCPSCQTDIYFK